MRRLKLSVIQRNNSMDKTLLCSAFYIDAMLTTNLPSVKRKLSMLPHISIISEGSKASYSIEGLENNAVIEFEKSCVTYRFYFEKPSMRTYIRNLLAFIAILGFLRYDYDIKLGSMHSYITYALAESMQALFNGAETGNRSLNDRIIALDKINMSLAKALISYQAGQKQLISENHTYKKFASEVLAATKAHGNAELLKSIGIDEGIIKSVAEVLGAKE